MELDDRLRALEARVAELESHDAPDIRSGAAMTSGDARFWALEGLRDRATAPGAVVFAGTVDLPPGEHVDWQWGEPAAALLDDTWDAQTERLTALAHPVRLELLRRVLAGVRTTAQLSALDVVGTSGQLYHHLNQLIAAGWLRQSGRGRYGVPAERVVPLLVILTAVRA